MSKPLEVEVGPCGYVAKCSVPWCRWHATTIMRYLDNRGRPYPQNAVCETHAREVVPRHESDQPPELRLFPGGTQNAGQKNAALRLRA
jgi:hypothetical protein